MVILNDTLFKITNLWRSVVGGNHGKSKEKQSDTKSRTQRTGKGSSTGQPDPIQQAMDLLMTLPLSPPEKEWLRTLRIPNKAERDALVRSAFRIKRNQLIERVNSGYNHALQSGWRPVNRLFAHMAQRDAKALGKGMKTPVRPTGHGPVTSHQHGIRLAYPMNTILNQETQRSQPKPVGYSVNLDNCRLSKQSYHLLDLLSQKPIFQANSVYHPKICL